MESSSTVSSSGLCVCPHSEPFHFQWGGCRGSGTLGSVRSSAQGSVSQSLPTWAVTCGPWKRPWPTCGSRHPSLPPTNLPRSPQLARVGDPVSQTRTLRSGAALPPATPPGPPPLILLSGGLRHSDPGDAVGGLALMIPSLSAWSLCTSSPVPVTILGLSRWPDLQSRNGLGGVLACHGECWGRGGGGGRGWVAGWMEVETPASLWEAREPLGSPFWCRLGLFPHPGAPEVGLSMPGRASRSCTDSGGC